MKEAGFWAIVRVAILFVAVALATRVAMAVVLALGTVGPATVVVDMTVHDGHDVDLWVNDPARPSRVATVVPGQRTQYRFEGITEDISRLELGPDDIQSEVALYGITVYVQDRVWASFDAEALSHWQQKNVTGARLEGGALHIPIDGRKARLSASVSLPLPGYHGARHHFLQRLVPLLPLPQTAVMVAMGGLALLLLLAAANPATRTHPLIAAAAAGGALLMVPRLEGVLASFPWTGQTAGFAAFHGREVAGAGRALAVVVVLGALAGAWQGRRSEEVPADRCPERPLGFFGRIGVVAASLVLLGYYFPDFGGTASTFLNTAFSPGEDNSNSIVWSAMVHWGYLPYRDFWFPYSGFFAVQLPLPWGELAHSFEEALLYLGFFLALWTIGGKRLGPAVVVATIVVTGNWLFWGASRYLIGVTVALSYVSGTLHADEGKPRPPYLFWLMVALAMVMEPAQAGYAAPAVAVCLVVDLMRERPVVLARVSRRLAVDFAVPAAFVGLEVAALAAAGMLPGVLDFFATAPEQYLYSARPFASLTDEIGMVIVAAPVVLAALGSSILARQGAGDPAGRALLALGLVGVAMMQKHLLSPIAMQMVLVPCVGVAVYAMTVPTRARLVKIVVTGALAGYYLGCLDSIGWTDFFWHKTISTPYYVGEAWVQARGDREAWARANAGRFARAKFSGFPLEVAVADSLQAEGAGTAERPVYMATGDAAIYVLLGQPSPYHVNLYNASPLGEQRRMARWLGEHPPWRVVWDSRKRSSDNVAVAARDPVLLAPVIEGYVPDRQVGPFDILRPRRPNEPVAFDHWAARLGRELRLAHLLEGGGTDGLPPCRPGNACRDVLEVTVANPGPRVSIPFKVGGADFSVAFVSVPGRSRYVLPLDRLWFVEAARRTGVEVRQVKDGLAAGVTVVESSRSASPDLLY